MFLRKRSKFQVLCQISFFLSLLFFSAEYVFAEPRIEVAGPEEMVVSADDMNCGDRKKNILDVPDVPPSAYRKNDGQVIFIAGNRQNFFMQGSDLNNVVRSGCSSILSSQSDGSPSEFRDKEWVMSLFSKNGNRVVAFLHNEYHGEDHGHPNCNITNIGDRECWYASSTIAVSEDGGNSFTRPEPPANVILSPPFKFKPGTKRTGVYFPKALGGADGNTYVLSSFVDRNRGIRIGQCLIRSTVAGLDKWEVWNGTDFVPYDPSPYGCTDKCTGNISDCKQVLPGNMFSIKYVPSIKQYVAVGIRRNEVVYRFSKNLIEWGDLHILKSTTPFNSWKKGEPAPEWYFSILDPTSKSRNFDTIESQPYLYFVRFRTNNGRLINSKRDIIRIPLRLL